VALVGGKAQAHERLGGLALPALLAHEAEGFREVVQQYPRATGTRFRSGGGASAWRANFDPGFPVTETGDGLIEDGQQHGLTSLVGTVPHSKPDHLRWWALLEEEMQEVAILRHHHCASQSGLGEDHTVIRIPEAELSNWHRLDRSELCCDPICQGW
jgi:hypothetical protein